MSGMRPPPVCGANSVYPPAVLLSQWVRPNFLRAIVVTLYLQIFVFAKLHH